MLRVKDVQAALQQIAPESWAFSFDKVGLQIGDPDSPVTRICFSLDSSRDAAEYAANQHCQLLLSHHPLIFHPLNSLVTGSHVTDIAHFLIQNQIAFLGCHTNWDVAPGGINDSLANTLGLTNIAQFGQSVPQSQYKLVVFAPEGAVQPLIDQLSKVGCGIIGDYNRCAFLSEGHGTFLAGETTNPTVGRKGIPETVRETRLEMLCPAHVKSAAIRTLIQAHPYEEPAFDLIPLDPISGPKLGRIGQLPSRYSVAELKSLIENQLDTHARIWLPNQDSEIQSVAVIGGAAAGEWKSAQSAGAQAFVTGEVPQHIALEAAEAGLVMIEAGHYATEQPGVAELAKAIRSITGVDVIVFEPEPGRSGRPI